MYKFISVMLLAATLAACAHRGDTGQVVVADDLRFALRSPASFGQQVLLVQAATLSFGSEQRELLFHTEITASNLAIVGSLPNGTRLFSITWDGATLHSEGYEELFARIPPAYFIADLQLAQWPLAEVEAGLAAASDCVGTGACVLSETADQLQRALSVAGATVVSISYDGVPHHQYDTRYQHHARQYQLNIETLDVQMLEAEP